MNSNFIPWQHGFLVMDMEMARQINSGDLDISLALSLVDSTVFICDEAIKRAMNEQV